MHGYKQSALPYLFRYIHVLQQRRTGKPKHKNMTCLFQTSNVARLGLRGAALAAPFGLVKPVQCFWGSKTEEAPKAGGLHPAKGSLQASVMLSCCYVKRRIGACPFFFWYIGIQLCWFHRLHSLKVSVIPRKGSVHRTHIFPFFRYDTDQAIKDILGKRHLS